MLGIIISNPINFILAKLKFSFARLTMGSSIPTLSLPYWYRHSWVNHTAPGWCRSVPWTFVGTLVSGRAMPLTLLGTLVSSRVKNRHGIRMSPSVAGKLRWCQLTTTPRERVRGKCMEAAGPKAMLHGAHVSGMKVTFYSTILNFVEDT